MLCAQADIELLVNLQIVGHGDIDKLLPQVAAVLVARLQLDHIGAGFVGKLWVGIKMLF